MRIDYHADRAFRSSNVFRFLVMINREEIALFPAIEVSVALLGRGLRKVRLGCAPCKGEVMAAASG